LMKGLLTFFNAYSLIAIQALQSKAVCIRLWSWVKWFHFA
jgi:hypothetical protein